MSSQKSTLATNHKPVIALTGATGFVGAAITDHLIAKGHQIITLVRNPSKLHRPGDVQIVEGALNDEKSLLCLCAPADIVIHCAGLTHALRNEDFFDVNVEGARLIACTFAKAHRHNPAGKRFVHISSLAARNPQISNYAASKHQSEASIANAIERENNHIEWVTLRAPAMYGPRDQATLPFFRSVKKGFAPIPGGKNNQRASILYVDDFAKAAYTAMTQAAPNQLYEVGDEKKDGHSWSEITDACAASLGVSPHKLKLPRALLTAWASPSSFILRALGKAPMVTADKIAEFFHSDWAARDNLLSENTSWKPQTTLAEGFVLTTRWYQQHGML